MDRKSMIMGGVAAGILLVAFILYMARSDSGAVIPTRVSADCACLACREPVHVEVTLTTPKPWTCPECGERAVYPLLVCGDCGKIFVPNLERRGVPDIEGLEEEDLPQMPIVPSCISCGSRNVRGYTGSDKELSPEDLVLPDWPQ